MNQNSCFQSDLQTSQSDLQAATSAETTQAADTHSAIGDWLATIIVWGAVISLGLAVAGFMLAEE